MNILIIANVYIFLNDKSIRKYEKSIKNARKSKVDFRILHSIQKYELNTVKVEQKHCLSFTSGNRGCGVVDEVFEGRRGAVPYKNSDKYRLGYVFNSITSLIIVLENRR